jgi:ligand-binding SRPBCC domain-containing protein
VIALRFESHLAAAPDVVWRRVTSVDGIDDEMAPLLRMTFPRGMRALPVDGFEPGQRLCRSWLLLLRVLPVDWSDLTLVELEPGRRFLERSPMFSMAFWQHERIVAPSAQGTTVVDNLAFRSRLLPRALVRASVALFFRHRHARLRRRFGVA